MHNLNGACTRRWRRQRHQERQPNSKHTAPCKIQRTAASSSTLCTPSTGLRGLGPTRQSPPRLARSGRDIRRCHSDTSLHLVLMHTRTIPYSARDVSRLRSPVTQPFGALAPTNRVYSPSGTCSASSSMMLRLPFGRT
ncbi:uncharacterized protein HMPREF1120_03483 [Exophiala dermatitidis NIH/UT8656]|uniref:Uncharacterized protein n=1 Tax=Exophiala dermatitidis (strain ATCC 34100 / CBS 525.76 / NIH/UT8656) TaxID=858893 RepID=H6BX56_EXODN|nr:uncharacterized protein HMPREF1120_03483 [Exophiala dermatitidis NIH/UT8656]EHY55342.1 hypothetical protein HMPREF1120_03483 [Exophiala dermatitidis NIH/UT8656]